MRVNKFTQLVRDAATSRQQRYVLGRFVLVGASFTLAYSALSSVFTVLANMPPAAGSALAYALCVPPGYLSQRNIAFRVDTPHRTAFPRYVLLQAPLLLLGAGLSWLFVNRAPWPEMISFLLIGASVAGVSFIAQRLWTFAHR